MDVNKASKAPDKRDPRAENVEGQFYVDHTCIDCDTCRWMAPETFRSANGQSAVYQQPTDRAGRVRALQALLSCPTFSIHATQREASELRAAQDGLPALVQGCATVYHCGWHSEKSFAGAAYLIVRSGPDGQNANVLVDSPRFNPVLARRIKEMGGIKYIFLTHKDDVADHAKWQAAFPAAQRILHATECTARQGTDAVEVKLQGSGPWALPDGSTDIQLVHTPGHTEGHVVLYYAPDRALLTGDHLSVDYEDPEKLLIFDDFNWYSVPQQVQSVAKLRHYDWLHVLPGHGRQAHLRDAAHRDAAIDALLEKHGAGATIGA